MHEARPSLTALMVAKRRAAHQLFDEPPLVLEDPIAVPILGADAEKELRETRRTFNDPVSRVGRAMVLARSRFAEEELVRAMARGVRQYVVLGAGLDTFAYRNTIPADRLRIFEVDHPATQAWKQELLAAARIIPPSNLTYVALDFEKQTLADGLRSAGFDTNAPAFFSWLGVTMYLSDEAITSTFNFVASLPPGGGIVLDYSLPRSSLNVVERLIIRFMARKVARMGEPFRNSSTRERMRGWLEGAGLHHVQDLSMDEVNTRYFSGRKDGLKIASHSMGFVGAEV